MTSDGVATPGTTGTPSSWARRTTAAERPGETRNRAPASTASSTWAAVTTVPAPTSTSGTSRAIASIAARPGGPERDLGDGQTAVSQRARDEDALRRVVDHDDRHDAGTGDPLQGSQG